MPNFLGTVIPSAILGAIGSGEEQRRRRDEMAIQEALNRYRAETLGLDRERLAETRRQADLQYGPSELDVPGLGKVSGPRWAIPSLIQAATSREKDISPEEVTALTGYRERALMPPGGTIKRGGVPWDPALEAEATKQAFPQFAGSVSPMTVDLPQVSVPRQSFQQIMTETGAQRKELDIAAQKEKQGKANARYRQLYSTGISQGVPHAVADATAITQANQEFGIAPEREAFAAEPREPREPRQPTEASLALDASGGDPAKALDLLKKQKRERGQTPVDLALEISGGDPQKALDLLQRNEQRQDEVIQRQAQGVMEEARRQANALWGRLGQYKPEPDKAADISRLAKRIAAGKPPEVQAAVAAMLGEAPPVTGRPTPGVRPQAPAGGAEQLSRRDPRYGWAQGQGMSDADIQQKYGVRIVD